MRDVRRCLTKDGKDTDMTEDELKRIIKDSERFLEPVCYKHRDYLGFLPPRVDCTGCWFIYSGVIIQLVEKFAAMEERIQNEVDNCGQ